MFSSGLASAAWVSQLATGQLLERFGVHQSVHSPAARMAADNDVGDTEDFDGIFNGGCFAGSCFAAVYVFA